MASAQSEPDLSVICCILLLSPLLRFLPFFQLSNNLLRCFLSKISIFSERKGGIWRLGRLVLVGTVD